MSDQAPADGAPTEEKKKRGRPKDDNAPPKPKNAFQQFVTEIRPKLKAERPELITDLGAFGKAMKEEWEKVPESRKEQMTQQYEKDMEIWRPKWEAYKKTQQYRDFVEDFTDYKDRKAQKKLTKELSKEAPKRPKSGYMIFAGEVREAVMERVRAEGLGLGGAGALIAEKWNALTEAQKGSYDEQSQKQKIAFDKEFGEYKKTEAYGKFKDETVKLVSDQQQKKIARTLLAEAPKPAPSAFSMFKSEVMPGILKENSAKKEGEKLDMGGIAKRVKELWDAASEEKKASLTETNAKLKQEVEEAKKTFKGSSKYTEFLEKRQALKIKENKLVQLREMPKRPKSVFAMFSEEHKDEVTPGKGEGKGRDALKTKFQSVSKEEKDRLEAERLKLEEQWKSEVAEYKSSVKYKTYEATQQKIMLEFKNEAIKVTTMKFLSDSPAAPPKTPFAIFVGEKRKAAGSAEGEKKTKEQKREEVTKFEAEWKKLDAGVKAEYDTKKKELMKKYQEDVNAFMAGEKWKDYVKEAKRLRIPVRSLLFHKKKIVAKLKDGKPNPMSVEMPSKPDSYPKKALNAMQIFTAEQKQSGVTQVTEIVAAWGKLSAEEKAVWDGKAAEDVKRHETEMAEFQNSEEGKAYLREVGTAQRRRRTIVAKNKYLGDYPVKPAAAMMVWMKSKAYQVRKDHPEAKGFQLKEILTNMWKELSPDEKAPLVEAATAKMQEFLAKEKEFKASDKWRRYQLAIRVRKFVAKKQVKGKGKAVAKAPTGPPKPESMPKKPLNSMMAFMKDEADAGRGCALGDAHKKFVALSGEEKQRYMKEAEERRVKHNEEMQAWEKSKDGLKYKRDCDAFNRSRRLKLLKDKYMKDEPKKGHISAVFLYMNDNRAKVMQENPDLKGLGQVQAKLSTQWRELSEEDKKPYIDREKEEEAKYKAKMEEFQASANYKAYTRGKASIFGKGKMKAKGKGKAAPLVQMPPKPAGLPEPPKNGMGLFSEERRKSGTNNLGVIAKEWRELGAEGQKKYMQAAEEAKNKYEADVKAFMRTLDGKKYFRLKAAAERKMKLASAKKRFLSGDTAPKEPKKPISAYFMFLGEKSKSLEASSMGDRARQISALWAKLEPEEKKVWEDRHQEANNKYLEELKVYRSSSQYKAYERTLNVVTGKRAKEQARAKAKKAALLKAREMKLKAAAAAKGAAAKPAAKAAAKDNSSDAMGSDSSSSSSSSSSDSD